MIMSFIVSGILYNSELLIAIEVNQIALGTGLGLSFLCLIFLLFTVCLFCKKWKWLAGVVKIHSLPLI